MTDQARRSLLKTLAYGTVLSTGVASSFAFAESISPADKTKISTTLNSASDAKLLSASGVTIFQQGSGLDQSVSLMNLTREPIYLHQMAPVSVENIDGSSQIKVNTVEHSGVVLEAGQRVSFDLSHQSAELASISSEHAAFNGSILAS